MVFARIYLPFVFTESLIRTQVVIGGTSTEQRCKIKLDNSSSLIRITYLNKQYMYT